MTEEENKAIERLKIIKEQTRIANEYGLSNNDFKEDIETYDLVLNLIQKQQKGLEKLKKNNKELLRKLKNRVKEVKKLTKYSLYKTEFSNLHKQLEKKDKIIKLMAETIIEDTCKLKTFWCNGCFSTCEYENVKDCVIKYFEKEAKKEE